MNLSVPKYILSAMQLMHDNGFSPYLVGGCVRDYIMNKTPHDFDITVGASPEEIVNFFQSHHFRTIPKGREFGTVGVLIEGEVIEITPYRTESGYNDSRHPDNVEFVKDIRLDLSRRDFTINAMAMDKDGNLLDIFGGCEDLGNKIIRCVGDPQERFAEDALRILRAIRFASRLGFEIQEKTRVAMSLHKSLLANISAERIQAEIKETLSYPHSYTILNDCLDIICELIPGFIPDEFLLSGKGNFASKLFSCIYNKSYDEICRICDFLKLSNADSDKIKKMHILYHDVLSRDGKKVLFDNKTKTALCDYPVNYVISLFEFSKSPIHKLYDFIENGIYTNSKLAYSGGDIASCGLFPKNMTAKLLHRVLYAVACNELCNTRECIYQFLIGIYKKEFE